MKKNLPSKLPVPLIIVLGVLLAPGVIHSQGWRLVGITGQQSSDDPSPQGGYLYPDNTLYEISLTNGALTKLFRPTWIPDSHSIGYNPVDGLLYHTGGANAYRDDPTAEGHEQGGLGIPGLAFQDNYYMEKINLVTQAMTAVYNANPPPNPEASLPAFGLPGPRPSWALPEERRDLTMTASSFRQQGPDEFSALRGLAWSTSENLFYATDGDGIYKITPGGLSTFLAKPAFPSTGTTGDSRAIAFVTVTELLVGHKGKDNPLPNGYLMRLNPATGEVLGELALTYPPGGGEPADLFGGLVGLAQHPVTGVLYGIRKTSDNFARELVTINPNTGATALVGSMDMHMAGLAFVPSGVPASPWRLVGITGQQSSDDPSPQGGYLYPDNTLYEISLTNGALTKLFRPTWIPDSHSIGYNPVDGLLYHTGGANAYRDDPTAEGHEQGGLGIPGLAFQDNYYMEKINLVTQAMTAVYNANPPPNPEASLPAFGLPGPRPSWALPEERRDLTMTASSFRQQGPDEFSALRGLAWSTSENLFYATDGDGIYKITPGGLSTFLAKPAFPSTGTTGDSRAIAFVTVTELLVGHKGKDNPLPNGYLMRLNPATGEVLGELALTYPPGGGEPADLFGGLVGLAQHPVTGVLYGIRKTSDNFARELVTINPNTGATALVGSMDMHMAGLAFVPTPPSAALQIQSVTRAGTDITITWTGGTPPYQLQTSTTLATGSWPNLGAPTSTLSATVPMNGPLRYYRVAGQ